MLLSEREKEALKDERTTYHGALDKSFWNKKFVVDSYIYVACL